MKALTTKRWTLAVGIVLVGSLAAACTNSPSAKTTTSSTSPAATSSTAPAPSASTTPASSGASIPVGTKGISVTPAAGWKKVSSGSTSVQLSSADGQVWFFVTVGSATTSNAALVLQSDITSDAHDPNFSGVQLSGSPATFAIPGSTNFDSAAHVGFTATGANNSGPVVGEYAEMVNSTSSYSAFAIAYSTNSSEYQNDTKPIADMLASLT